MLIEMRLLKRCDNSYIKFIKFIIFDTIILSIIGKIACYNMLEESKNNNIKKSLE